MAGIEVTRQMLDQKMAASLVKLREAYEQVGIVAQWFENHPAPGADPLVDVNGPYGYTTDEAYAMRLVFQNLETSRTDLAPTFDIATQLTGLE